MRMRVWSLPWCAWAVLDGLRWIQVETGSRHHIRISCSWWPLYATAFNISIRAQVKITSAADRTSKPTLSLSQLYSSCIPELWRERERDNRTSTLNIVEPAAICSEVFNKIFLLLLGVKFWISKDSCKALTRECHKFCQQWTVTWACPNSTVNNFFPCAPGGCNPNFSMYF